MLSNALAARLDRRGLHYGWVVAAVTFLTMLATAGAMGSAGLLIEPLGREFGWSPAEVSSAFAVRLLLFGLLGPFTAAFMNALGLRAVVTAALVLIAGGIFASFFMQTLWQLMLFWGVVVGIGTGMTAMVLGATVATRWFTARRGLVMGALTASNATGQLVFLPLLASISETAGWRVALTVVVAALAVTLALALLLLRDHPADVGLPAYGETRVTPVARSDRRIGAMLAAPLRQLGQAGRTGTFWILLGSFFICGLSTNGLIQTHWISICGDFGIAPVAAAGLLAMMGAFDLAGTLGSGWLSDRFDPRYLLCWYYGLRGLSLVFLSMSGFGPLSLGTFAVFYGLDWIATVPPTVKLIADRFGRERTNLVFGWVFAGHQLGAATAAFGAGVIRTDLLTYMPALWIAGVMCLLAAVMVLGAGRSRAEPLPAAA